MLSNWTNKRKFIGALIGLVIFAWLAYRLTFAKTFALLHEYRTLKSQQVQIKDMATRVPELKAHLERLNNMFGEANSEDFSVLVMDELNELCSKSGIVLKDIPQKHVFDGDGIRIETIDVNFQGAFKKQLAVISNMENNDHQAKIRSVQFQLEVDKRTNRKRLLGTIFLQSIQLVESKSNEESHENK